MNSPMLRRLTYCVVGIGGALGASVRYSLQQLLDIAPVYEIAIVNLVGCGVLAVVLVKGSSWFPQWHRELLWRPFWATGVLGGFTTTSAFAVLANAGDMTSVVASMVSVVAGFLIFDAVSKMLLRVRGAQ